MKDDEENSDASLSTTSSRSKKKPNSTRGRKPLVESQIGRNLDQTLIGPLPQENERQEEEDKRGDQAVNCQSEKQLLQEYYRQNGLLIKIFS